jgi:hypothetical protein
MTKATELDFEAPLTNVSERCEHARKCVRTN